MLKLYYKVWSGLTKFIRSQVKQQRCVHFSLLGSFSSVAKMEGNNSQAGQDTWCYTPDVNFLDRGNFKFSDDEHNNNPYSDSKMNRVQVSPSSIASVCGTTTEVVSYILKDIVSKALLLCKEGVGVRLNLKIGYLNLYHSRVYFEAVGHSNKDNSCTQSLNRLIGRRVNKSFGGSPHMTDLTVRSSVKTPGSVASFYSGRSKHIHASNPNPQVGENVHPRVNQTMYSSFLGRDSGMSKRDKSATHSERLPFPFVSGLLGGHSYTKPGKRVFFTKRQNNKDVLQNQLEQITYNQQKKKNDHDNERKHDKELLKGIKENINKEEFKKRQFNDLFRTHYKMYNDNKRIENETNKNLALQSKNQEKYNYFPYTHGDEIEKKRRQQKDQLTEELREKYSYTNSKSSTRHRKNRMNHSFTNGMFSKGEYSPGMTMSSGFQSLESTNRKVPVKYITDYPAFLKPFKHYPYRRLNDTHVEKAMQSAMKRHEEEIQAKERERQEDAERYRQQLEENKNYTDDLEVKRKKAQMENKQLLLEQMKKESYRRLKNKLQDKEQVNTNFGPEENDSILNDRKESAKKHVSDLRKELEKQMFEKHQARENEKMMERMEDLEAIAKAKRVLAQENEEYFAKDKLSKQVYKEAWREQANSKFYHHSNMFIY